MVLGVGVFKHRASSRQRWEGTEYLGALVLA